MVGSTTSGGIDHDTGAAVAFAFVDPHLADGAAVQIRLLDQWYPAVVKGLGGATA
jgi:glycine cleavage system aminomethyltransferase T